MDTTQPGPAEWRALLKAANSRFRLVLHFAVRTAMRREEIAGLTWDRVNLQRRIVYLPKTKNGEQRTIPLSRRVVAILRQAGPKPSGSVFGMSADAISAAMIDTRHRAGIEDLRFHDLRHEATSRLFEQTDLDVMEIKSITGHKSLRCSPGTRIFALSASWRGWTGHDAGRRRHTVRMSSHSGNPSGRSF